MVAAAARPARARRGHRQAREHERLGQRDQERVVVDPVLAVHERGRGHAREGHREAVDLLAALALGEPPVGDRREVADARRRSPSGAWPARCAARSRGRRRRPSASARRTTLAARVVVVERRDRRGDAVVGEARGHGDERQAGERRRRTWRRRASGRRRCRPPRRRSPARSRAASSARRLDRAALDGPDLRRWRAAAAACRRSPRRGRARRRPRRGRRWRSGGRPAAAPRPATAPGPMSIASGVPTMRVSSGTRPPGPARGRVVVDLDPLDDADRRDADAAAAVGELLEAVLVVELRVAPPGRLERVGQRGRRRAGSISVTPMYSPCAVAGSSDLWMRSR